MFDRVRIAFVLLLALAAFALWGHICIETTADALDAGIESARAALMAQDYTAAHHRVADLQQLCRQKQHLLTVFVRRDLVSALHTGLAGIDAYLQTDYIADAHLELDRAAGMVQAIRWQYFDIA